MGQDNGKEQSDRGHRTHSPGPFTRLLGFPFTLAGILLGSLLVSLLIEFACMTFLWPEDGAAHSYRVMVTESGWLSEGYRQSLLMSEPVITTNRWIHAAWQWLFVDSGFSQWLQGFQHRSTGTDLVGQINAFGSWIVSWLEKYLQATIWVTIIFFIRVMILFLSIPLFILTVIVGVVEGLVRRDLRRYGAGYESSFVYHHAKRFIKYSLYGPCMLYLAWPCAVWPNLLLVPAALMGGTVLTVVMATFKKYL